MTERRWGRAVVLAACAVLAWFPTVAVPAAPAPRPPQGWPASRVRFEPAGPGGEPLEVVGVGVYRGAIEVAPSGNGLDAIDDVGLEDYLRGLSEVPSTWPAEALKAQAIAARSYALWQMSTPSPASWRAAGADICATDDCQVYRGVNRERQPGGPAWSAAVDETAGSVLLWRSGVIKAKYSASNGGRSVPGGAPWLPSVDDPDDARVSPYARWRSVMPLGAMAGVFGVQPPQAVVAVARQGDDVVATVQGPDGGQVQTSLPEDEFRRRVNTSVPTPPGLPRPLPSDRFSLGTTPEGAVADGMGYGHGIGLSQFGALGKALRGMRAEAILGAYYGGITPTRLPATALPRTIKVAVAIDQPSVTVVARSPVRVLDAQGNPLAVLADGAWQVTAVPGGLRVVPPAAAAGPLVLDEATLGPSPARVGSAVTLRFRLPLPALVSTRVRAPGAAPLDLPAQAREAGEVTQVLPPPSEPGVYEAVLRADAGAGRVSEVTLLLDVDRDVKRDADRAPDRRSSPRLVAVSRPASWPRTPGGLPGAFAIVLAGVLLAFDVRLLRQLAPGRRARG